MIQYHESKNISDPNTVLYGTPDFTGVHAEVEHVQLLQGDATIACAVGRSVTAVKILTEFHVTFYFKPFRMVDLCVFSTPLKNFVRCLFLRVAIFTALIYKRLHSVIIS